MEQDILLSVENLKTYFYTNDGIVRAVDGVSFKVKAGEAMGLAGESGCGKSVTCLSIIRLLPKPAGRIAGGRIVFDDVDLVTQTEKQMRKWRGKQISMILQDPLMALNPVYTIRNQLAESFWIAKVPRNKIMQRVVDMLNSVKIPSAEERLNTCPFQFSGGMRHRTCAAISDRGRTPESR